MVTRAAIAIAIIAAAGEAYADEGRWGGLYDGRTLQTGGEAFAEGGFPGAGLGVLFGTSENIDLGLRATFTYSGVGVYATDNFVAAPGFDPRVVARFAIANRRVASLLFRLEPGVRFARFDPSTRWGPEIVAALDFGLHVMRRGTVHLGVEIPIYLDIPNTTPSNPFAVLMPILFGAGFEYHATGLIGFGARVNPGIDIAAGDIAGSPKTGFALLAQGYFMLRWGALAL
ncbi:MAG TPA: hypothetical protein VGH87_27205 [Polyangiaceae bacterium]|jgi:hypothetical protein